MKTTWTIDSNQSDVLIKMRHSIIACRAHQWFDGHIDIDNNEIADASFTRYKRRFIRTNRLNLKDE
jgi:carotenoid cleavage dioxygenase-like enzyme